MIDLPLGATLLIGAVTHNPSALNAITDADTPPTYDVFHGTNDTPMTGFAGIAMTKRTSQTGAYRSGIVGSAGNGFAIGEFYQAIIVATVGGTIAKKLYEFRIVAAELNVGIVRADLTVTPPTAGAIASAVYEEPAAGHVTVGTFGDKFRAHQAAVKKLVVGSGSTTTALVLNSSTGVDGGAPNATNDTYAGRIVVFLTGALADQATSVESYDAGTKTLTIAAVTGAASAGDLALLL